MSDTTAPEAPDGSPSESPGPTPGPTPEPAAPGANRLARDGFDLIADGIMEPFRREQIEQLNRELIMAGADTQGIRARDRAENRQLDEMRRQEEERQRQQEAEQRHRERLASALDEHEAAVALEAEPDKKSPGARRLTVVRDAANRRSRTVKWAAPTAVALAIALVFVGVFVAHDKDDPVAAVDSVVASVTSEAATAQTSPTTSASRTTATAPASAPTNPATATTTAEEDPVAGRWDFSAVAGAAGTGGHIADFTLADGTVETDTGYTGTYEVIREGDVTKVEITLTGELGGRVSHAWFHMRLENGALRGTGEADALGSANESSTSTTRTTIKFQNEIVGTRIAG